MSLIRLFVLVLPLLAATASAQEVLPLGGGVPLADRMMENVTGDATSFQRLMGPRGLAVIFWSNTCPWVRRSEDRVLAVAAEYGANGVGFVLVNSNDPEAIPEESIGSMRGRMSERQYPFPYLVDAGSEAARSFGAVRTPQVFLFDGDGRLVYEGAIDDSPADVARVEVAYFREALSSMVAGVPVRVERTRAFGCTIKYAGEG